MSTTSPHHKPGPEVRNQLVEKDGKKLIIKPRAFDIIWGADRRYWLIPGPNNPKGPVELVQVSWLEVTGSLDLSYLDRNQSSYKVTFNVELKPDAFGWADSPVYLMTKVGKKGSYTWRKVDLSQLSPREKTSIPLPHSSALTFKVPASYLTDDKVYFGICEIWKGRWKGGLVIHEAIIEPYQN